MLNEEVDDTEFFQQDFTTASEWEIFNARLEEIFHEWKLSYGLKANGKPLERNQLSLCEWFRSKEKLKFADVELDAVWFKANVPEDEPIVKEGDEAGGDCQAFVDLMANGNDYCIVDQKVAGELHPLAQWYGLREFVVIVPVKNSMTNESQIRILMSSVHIAIAESSCNVPVFVQILDKVQNVFMGVCESGSTRMSFDIVHLNITPPTCKYLSGLLEVFKGKVGVQYMDPVAVSVRFTYSLSKFLSASYVVNKKVPFAENGSEDNGEENLKISLPFGVAIDPVSELVLHCTWDQVADNVVIDSQTYSDFDPLTAPAWSLRARFEDTPVCYMSDCIQEFLHVSESRRAITEYFPELAFGATQNLEGTKALERLTESKIPTLSSVIPGIVPVGGTVKKADHKLDGPLNEEQLKDMLYYLFPDAQKDSPYEYMIPKAGETDFDPLKIKSACPDSLVHRLATLLAVCNAYYGGKRAVAQLWAEFSQEMRYRVERCIQIPGIAAGFPDSRTCLLHQKLQMLNICMERRKIREGGLPFSMTGGVGESKEGDREGSHESEDEFFDCSDEDDEENKKRHAPWNQPVGRLSKLGKMLLVDSDEPLYIPITQEPVPKTEDQLEDDAEVMLKLGPGSELCTQMMSASLLSDMESFKAANPAGKLEDFIRWYSPRDWIEEQDADERDPFGRKGHLSSRMLIPGNTWQTVWGDARPVPARRQRRLFDDAKEAEKVLHYFDSRSLGQIAQLTMSALFHTAIRTLKEQAGTDSKVIPNFEESMEKATATCCKLSRENWIPNAPNRGSSVNQSIKKFEALLSDITQLENLIIQVRSLRKKLFPDGDGETSDREQERAMLSNMLKALSSELEDGAKSPLSKQLLSLFTEVKMAANEQANERTVALSLPDPVEKQFTLRLGGETINKGMGSPQFMRAILINNEFRLCGAFSQNTTFY